MAIEGRIITVAAGTPVRLETEPLIVSWLYVEMLAAAGAGMGYLMLGVRPGTTPVANTNPTIQLTASAGATAPGGSFELRFDVNNEIDLSRVWVDGAHTGDTVLVMYNTKSR